MAVVLRLSRAGTHKAPFYHVVATDSRKPRDGRYLEDVGIYDPTRMPELIQLKAERVEHWLKAGAKPSQTVAMVLKRAKRQQARGEEGLEARHARPRPLARPRARRGQGRGEGRGHRARPLDGLRAHGGRGGPRTRSSGAAGAPPRPSGRCSTAPPAGRGAGRCWTSSTDRGARPHRQGGPGASGSRASSASPDRKAALARLDRVTLRRPGRRGGERGGPGGEAAGAALGGAAGGRRRPDGRGGAGRDARCWPSARTWARRARGATTGPTSRGCRW